MALSFCSAEHVPYGAILIDLPDPREESLAKLYSVEAYRLCRKLLSPQGVLATQASSPYHVPRGVLEHCRRLWRKRALPSIPITYTYPLLASGDSTWRDPLN